MAKVLIVEDNPKILELLAKLSSKLGYEILKAYNGREGLELVEKNVPDLILTDIYMPRMSGLEMCRHLKRNRKFHHIPIIIITASTENPDLVKVFEYGANAWIKKPFSLSDVTDCINEVKQEKRFMEKSRILGDWIHFNLKSNTDILKSTNRFMENLLSHSSLDSNEVREYCFAVNEMILNAMEHGNRFSFEKKVDVSYVMFKDKVVVKIKDEGTGFDYKQIPDPITHPSQVLEERNKNGIRPGGFGIHLSKKYIDRMEYSDSGNELILTKFLDTAS